MKTLFLVALLCASARTSLANGGGANVILSGNVTTVTADTAPHFTKTNEKHFLVIEQQTGAYHVFRLHREGPVKTIQSVAAGTLRSVVVPGDKKFQTEFFLYTDIAHDEDSMFGIVSVTDTWLQIGGVASDSAGASIHAVFSVPPRFSYSRREIDVVTVFIGGGVESSVEQSGKLKLEMALSLAANDAGDDHAAAVTRLLNHLHDLGFSGP
jgi:hypothetical protein